MRVSTVGALCVSLCLSAAAASAEDVTVALAGANVPIGPAGTTVLEVTRSQIGHEHFAVVRARAPERASRCGATPERVAVWSMVDQHWTELAHELVDRCLPGPVAMVNGQRVDGAVRARVVEIVEGPQHRVEFHVRLLDPRAPQDMTSLVRYHRAGDRFVAQRPTEALAPTPGLAPRHVLAALTDARVDGRLGEWSATSPVVASDQGSVWMAQQGDRMIVAAEVRSDAAPTLALTLLDADAGTARLRGVDGNRGRVVRLACEGDAAVRCAHDGDRWRLEGSVDLSAQLYHQRTVSAVGVLAVVEAGGHRVFASSPDLRLEAVGLATPIDLLRGASPAVVARCGGGFMGRAPLPGVQSDDPTAGAMVTCGATCRGGQCEQTVGTGDAASRLEFADAGRCFRGTGPGAAEVDGCRAGMSARLVGAMPVQGFNAVLGVERTWQADGMRWHQGEIWTLVTASSEWRRVTVGEAVHGDPPLYGSVQIREGHPAMCDEPGTACEVVSSLTMHRREQSSDSVTGDVVATLRGAGLIARRDTP